MKIIITGSSGYVGYVLSRHFSEKGICVTGIDVKANPVWSGNGSFSFIKCSVTEFDELKNVFKTEQPTHVIHLAYLMNPLHNKKMEYLIDVQGSINVLKSAEETTSVRQLIEMSSTSAYGAWSENKFWLTEEDELRPRDYRYGIYKKQVEERYAAYKKRENLNIVILRMCTLIGPSYFKKGGVVSILANSPILVNFSGNPCELQFIHEDDLTEIFSLILNDGEIEGVYNLAPDSYALTTELADDKKFISFPLSIARALTRILWILRLSPNMPSAITLGTYGIVADPGKLMRRYNYRFKYSTHDAFVETVRKRRELGTL